jgi:hypothetical protein
MALEAAAIVDSKDSYDPAITGELPEEHAKLPARRPAPVEPDG